MSQVTEQSVRFQTALASIKLIQASAVLDLTEDDFDFLTSNKVWIATDRSRARLCVEACVYGTLDFVVYLLFFFFNDTATTEIYTLSLHDALPIPCSSVPFAFAPIRHYPPGTTRSLPICEVIFAWTLSGTRPSACCAVNRR